MALQTYPNQRIVKIHREEVQSNFLGIKNENWQAASRDLGAHGLRLYLYLAANANNFQMILSPAMIQKEIGVPRSTCHDQFHILENKGYIRQVQGNIYEFFERPQPSGDKQTKDSNPSDGQLIDEMLNDGQNISSTEQAISSGEHSYPFGYTEININTLNNRDDFYKKQKPRAKESYSYTDNWSYRF
uniref:Uncharacterized protein n=1 Tax=uncultured Bacillota bacterium TaxID=344338 RepID=A0A650EMH0_9FIRM|nr:hypothetical protein Firmicute1046_0450 [uncultured Firmicutes bacterium]